MQEPPNRDRLGKAVDIYRDALRNFIVETLQRIKGATVAELLLRPAERDQRIYQQRKTALDAGKKPAEVIDVNDFPHVVNYYWREAFDEASQSDRLLRNRMHIIAAGRNDASHPGQGDIDRSSAVAYTDAIAKVLGSIGAEDAVAEVRRITDSFFVNREGGNGLPPPQTAHLTGAYQGQGGVGANGGSSKLVPWRMVIDPHPDVLNGDLTNAKFAANLKRVATSNDRLGEYNNPVEFFNRTVITQGVKLLLANTLRRLAGTGGEPVVHLKTSFGGGKTHSLIALYHLANSGPDLGGLATDPSDEAGRALKDAFESAEIEPATFAGARVAVLGGTARSTTDVPSPEGLPLNTMWGYMAYSLGGPTAYEMIGQASRAWEPPGTDQLDPLLASVAPCVILVDELVAYARTLNSDRFGKFTTFFQALTESVANTPGVALVVTVLENSPEMGGDRGVQTMDEIERILARVESISAPVETQDAYAVVRKRLFEETSINSDAMRATVSAFTKMYARNKAEFPQHASDHSYSELMEQCYPVHPEVFHRLFEDWAAVDGFQRTRAILRLMAAFIRRLYGDSDDPLIMPGSLRLDDAMISQDFAKVLPERWDQVFAEIDGPNSRSDQIDRSVRFQRCGDGAAKRVARTVFLGSVPGPLAAKNSTGLEDPQIRLGVVQPGDGTSVYNDALTHLGRTLHHLHTDGTRTYFHTSPNLLRLHQHVVRGIGKDAQHQRMQSIIEGYTQRYRGPIAPVVFPSDHGLVDDDQQVSLVVLHPDHTWHKEPDVTNPAETFARAAVTHAGISPRVHRNTVVFVCATKSGIAQARRESADLIGWEILEREHKQRGLTETQRMEAARQRTRKDGDLQSALMAAYSKVMLPWQEDPAESSMELHSIDLNNRTLGDIINTTASTLRCNDELVDDISPANFDRLLRKHIWKDDDQFFELNDLWEQFTRHPYLPRFVDRHSFDSSILELVQSGDVTYAITDSSDLNREFKGVPGSYRLADNPRFLVRGQIAEGLRAKGDHDSASRSTQCGSESRPENNTGRVQRDTAATPVTSIDAFAEFDGNASSQLLGTHLDQDVVEVARRDGGTISVRISIEARKVGGFADYTVRAILENAVNLGLRVETGQ